MAKTTKYSGTQTEKNLEAAFAGESQARNKYTYFASVAKKQGFEQIADLFLKTADNEKEHAKMWFKELNGIGDTAENLLAAAEGENYESALLPLLKSTTKKDTVHYSAMLKLQKFSKGAKSRFGNAVTAVTLL